MAHHLLIPWGPYEVPLYVAAAGRGVDTDRLDEFWDRTDECKDERGCYVFGMRSGGGTKPVYVGKATRSFGQECFSPHKLLKVNSALADYVRGRLVVFFVCEPQARGPVATRRIARVESELIEYAYERNSSLQNSQSLPQEARWGIKGVLRSGRGRPHADESAFAAMMGM